MHAHLSWLAPTPTQLPHAGHVVLVTGGGGGIGKAAARRFLAEGASVVLSGTRRSVLEAAQAELDPSGDAHADPRRPHHHAGRRPGARRRRHRAVRRRRHPRQQHRHLPPGPVPRADRGTLRGGARLDPAPDLLGLAGRGCGRWSSAAAARSSTSARCGPSTRSPRRRRAPTPPPRPAATRSPRTSRSSWRRRTSASTRSPSRSSRRPPTSASSRPTTPAPCSTPSTAFHPLGRHGVPEDVVDAIALPGRLRRGLDHGHDPPDRRRRPRGAVAGGRPGGRGGLSAPQVLRPAPSGVGGAGRLVRLVRACSVRVALQNGGIEGEGPGDNVTRKGRFGPDVTFAALSEANVTSARFGAIRVTFSSLPRRSRSGLPLNAGVRDGRRRDTVSAAATTGGAETRDDPTPRRRAARRPGTAAAPPGRRRARPPWSRWRSRR